MDGREPEMIYDLHQISQVKLIIKQVMGDLKALTMEGMERFKMYVKFFKLAMNIGLEFLEKLKNFKLGNPLEFIAVHARYTIMRRKTFVEHGVVRVEEIHHAAVPLLHETLGRSPRIALIALITLCMITLYDSPLCLSLDVPICF